MCRLIEIEQGALADKFTVGFDGKRCAITPTGGSLGVVFRVQSRQRLWHRWIPTSRQFYLHIIIEAPQVLQIVSGYRSQDSFLAVQHGFDPILSVIIVD